MSKLEGDSRSAGRSGSGDCSGPSCRRFWKESVDSASLSVSFVLFPTLFQFFGGPFFIFIAFASSTTLVISWTRDCRSSLDLFAGGVLVSACSAPISLPWMNFGWSKPGDAKSSECFAFVSWIMCCKVEIPRRPLQGQPKSHQIWISASDGRSYSPMFWGLSSKNDFGMVLKSLNYIPRR